MRMIVRNSGPGKLSAGILGDILKSVPREATIDMSLEQQTETGYVLDVEAVW